LASALLGVGEVFPKFSEFRFDCGILSPLLLILLTSGFSESRFFFNAPEFPISILGTVPKFGSLLVMK
jgi:hypothetical protein